MTSSIARMNCFLHGIEDFQIVRGDTLSEPKLVQGDRLMRFDVVLANPPYSIKQWDREAFASDPWGRNLYGTPPQGRADYAFWQHILLSLAPKTGRCAILFPHGVLFRQEEAEMRRKMIDADVIECVIGLGPNLFYNSPMEACIVICRAAKPKARKGKILFINAVGEVTRERAQSFLTDEHIERIAKTYETFKKRFGFAAVATLEEIRGKDGNLSIPLYVEPEMEAQTPKGAASLASALSTWLKSRDEVTESLSALLPKTKPTGVKSRWKGNDTCKLLESKANWNHVRFGEVVENVNETEQKPSEAGLERFIGLEHLEPGSLHVRTWGDVASGTTFTRRCKPGQVLFGKRRAYQRKVAIAEFDAVVSGDIYVFTPKDHHVLPEFLPFLCTSDRFFRHAVGTSAGSLSPRTNWTSLADFEFGLAPLEQQRRVAELLWAMDESLRSSIDLQVILSASRDAFFDEQLKTHTSDRPESLKTLGEALSGIIAGKSPKASSRPASIDEFGVLEVSAAGDGVFRQDENKALLDFADFVPALEVKPGMILVTRCNALLSGIGRACLVDSTRPGLMLSDKTLRLVAKAQCVNQEFLLQGLLREPYRGFVERAANGTEAKNITQKTLRAAPFWIPPIATQLDIVKRLREYSTALIALREQQTHLEGMQSTLIGELVQ